MTTFKKPAGETAFLTGLCAVFGLVLTCFGIKESSLYLMSIGPVLLLLSVGIWFQSRSAGRILLALFVCLLLIGGIAMVFFGKFSWSRVPIAMFHLYAIVTLWLWLRNPANTVPHLDEQQWRRLRRLSFKIGLCLFIIFLGIIFIPWDVKAPNAPELEWKRLNLASEANAFTAFAAAQKSLTDKFPDATMANRDWMTMATGNAKEQWDPVFADTVLAANAETLRTIEKGLACDLYESPPMPDLSTSMPWLQKYKRLALLLSLKSKRAQLAGDHAEAARVACQGWEFGRSILRNPNSMIEWLVGLACERIALDRMENIVADGKTTEPVLRDLLTRLDRWDPQEAGDGHAQTMRAEYRFGLNTFKAIHDHPNSLRAISSGEKPDLGEKIILFIVSNTSYFLKPNMMDREMTQFYVPIIRLRSGIYAEFRRSGCFRPPPADAREKWSMILSPNSVGNILFAMLTPAMQKTVEKRCDLQAVVAALRLKTALRLYEQSRGQLPESLGALVPELLKEIPIDPYDGQAFRYSKPEKKVWSVGRDLKDDGGKMRDAEIMRDFPGCDLVMPLGTRETKSNLAPPSLESNPAISGTK
jgi:hypothetical protein